jgi:hypothetical protein
MKTSLRVGASTLLWLAAALDVTAQTQGIYRCGPGGRQLQQHPCGASAEPAQPGAAAAMPKAADERAAQRSIRELQDKAERMERARLAQEARDQRATARATGINTRPAPPREADAGKSPRKARVQPLGAARPVPRGQQP